MTAIAYPGTQSVLRAMALLKAFDDDHQQWGLSDLARETGLNKTTVFRLLSALESEGMVARSVDGEGYILGPEIVAMGGRALRANDLRTIALPELRYLAAETGETASLESLSWPYVLVIEEIAGDHLVGGAQEIGSRWPMHVTSTGLSILAFLPDEKQTRYFVHPLTAVTNDSITDTDLLSDELRTIRQRGYAVADEALEVGLVAIGAPLLNHDGEAVAAISIAGPKVRLSAERISEIGPQVAAAAQRISSRLGYRP